MRNEKRAKLEATGWKLGTASEFLGLTKQETEFVEMKLALARGLRRRRNARKMTQAQLARLVGSSQSRIAKMEAADPAVSLDLLVRSLLATGATRREVAGIIRRQNRSSAA
jgi:DNA-binding XRE family transcriptional regulator